MEHPEHRMVAGPEAQSSQATHQPIAEEERASPSSTAMNMAARVTNAQIAAMTLLTLLALGAGLIAAALFGDITMRAGEGPMAPMSPVTPADAAPPMPMAGSHP